MFEVAGGPSSSSATFARPTVKKGFNPRTAGQPFPNFTLGKHELPAICRCTFDGDSFYVINTNDIHVLNHNGSFGVSSLTFRGLSYQDPSFFKKPYFAKHIQRASLNHSRLSNAINSSLNNSSNVSFCVGVKKLRTELLDVNEITLSRGRGSSRKACISSETKAPDNICSTSELHKSRGLIEEGDNDSKKDQNLSLQSRKNIHLEDISSNIEEERLILMPEEAIFLSFGVGCLVFHNSRGESLDYRTVWKRLVELNPEFPITYAVYHYFRSKNWVPKIGESYGASYLLYKIGPAAYHASYLVHILGFPSQPTPTWNELNSWVRLGSHVSKNVLLCEVSLPRKYDALSSEPRSIFEMSLKETSIFRWKPCSHLVAR